MTSGARTWEEIKRIKSCSVYFFPDVAYIVAAARTVPGFEIDAEPIFDVRREAAPSKLGDAIIAALNSYQLDVSPPDPRSKNVGPLLKRTGLKSWKQLEKKGLHVRVSLDGAAVRVMPTMRDPVRGGYEHKPDLAFECELVPADIGVATLQALERCS